MSDPFDSILDQAQALGQKAQQLRVSMGFGFGQNPDQAAQARQVAAQLGTTQGYASDNLKPLATAAKTNAIDYDALINQAPRASEWFSNPMNAAVGHDALQDLAGIEHEGDQISSMTPGQAWRFKYADPFVRTLQSYPLTRAGLGIVGGALGMLGNVGSFFGWHGEGPTQRNPLQRAQIAMDPGTTGAETVEQSQHLPFDTLGQNIAPLLPATAGTAGIGLAAKALGTSEKVVQVLQGLGMGGLFTADQGGATYTQALEQGKTPDQARSMANKVALVAAPANLAFGFTPLSKTLHENPLVSSLLLGGFQGGSSQVGSNLITGAPAFQGVPGAAVHGAAFQGGLHMGFDVLGGLTRMTDLADASPLKARSPEVFQEATAHVLQDSGAENLLIPAAKLQTFFQTQGMEPVQAAEALGVKNFAESLASGSDAIVPTANFLAKLSAEQHDALLPDIRLRPGDLTLNELQEHAADVAKSSDEVKAQAEQLRGSLKDDPARQAIYEDTRRNLLEVGYEPSTADAYALTHTQAMMTLAERSGIDPMALHEQYGLQIFRPRPGEDITDAILRNSEERVAQGGQASRFEQGAADGQIEGNPGEPDSRGNAGSDGPLQPDHEGASGAFWPEGGRRGLDPEVQSRLRGIADATRDGLPSGLYGAGLGAVEGQNASNPIDYHGEISGQRITADTFNGSDVLIRSSEKGPRGEHAYLVGSVRPDGRFQVGEMDGAGIKGIGRDLYHALGNYLAEVHPDVAHVEGLAGGTVEDPEGIRHVRNSFNGTQWADQIASTPVEGLMEGPAPRDTRLFQGGPMDFGTKEWQEYYSNKMRGNRSRGDMANRARAALRAALTDRGGREFDAQREMDLRTEEDLFQAWDKEVKALQAGEVHPDETRGFLQFGEDRKMSIGLLQKADLSTFLHESGHFYLEVLKDLAARPDAPEQIRNDFQAVRNWLGAGEGEEITREQHEQFARANEAYLMEGKAPSEKLAGTFARFKGWLQLIYQKISSLGVNLSPEIRGVFDRLYASDQEIEAAQGRLGEDQPFFTTAAGAGMTQAEFDLYRETRAREIEKAKESLSQQVLSEFQRQKEAAWKSELQDVRQEMAARVDQEPARRAWKSLVDGALEDGTPIKLDRQQLVDRIGEEATKGLARSRESVYAREGGMDLDTAAELLGFQSGDELAGALRDMEPRRDVIERLAQEEMIRRHGDSLTDGTVADKAVEALHNRFREDAMALELKALRQQQALAKPFMDYQKALDEAKSDQERQAAQAAWEGVKAEQARQDAAGRAALKVPPMDSFRLAARAFVNDTAVKDLQPQRYLDGQRMASQEAFKARAKGDYQAAADAKQKEILNHFLYREALQAQKDVGRFEDFATRLQSKAGQQRLGKAGGDYLDQVNALLGRYELARVTNKELGRRQSLIEWSQRLYEEGKEPDIDPAILNEARQVNYRQATMSEIRALHDALKNISHLAGQELGMIVNGKRIDFEQARDEMIASLRRNYESKPLPVDVNLPMSVGEKAVDLPQRGDALLMRMERLMDWMDGGDLDGPWHRNIWNNIADAQGREYALAEQITQKLGDALENMPRERRMALLDTFDIEGVGKVTKKFILSAALNMGNEENQAKLLKGMGWGPEVLGRMMDHMDAGDWRFVQETWNTLEGLWPEIAALEKRMTGLEPVKVQPRPFEAKDRDGNLIAQLDGGYYPVVYDPRRSVQGAKQEAGDVSKMFESGYARATTPKGHTKERVNFAAPMLLDFEQVLTQHTTKVIKDLTHREAVVAANKLIMDRAIRDALQETLGPAYEKQMLPWLRGVVNDRNGSSVQGLGDFSRWMMKFRSNTVSATMAWKFATMELQLTHIPRMLDFVKPGDYAQAMIDFLAHPKAMTDQIRNLSPNEMAFRGENIDRDIRAALQTQTGQASLRHDITRLGMQGVAIIDHCVSFPLWLGVYRQALREGRDASVAVNTADRAVRLGLGASSAKDLPAIMRNNELAKTLTMFYGFHNGLYNQLRDMGHQVHGISDMPKFLGRTVLAVIIPAVLSQMVMGHGPGDDENKASWIIKKSLLFSMDTIPILRDISNAIDHGGDAKFTPMYTAIEKAAKTANAAYADTPNKDWGDIAMGAGETMGYAFGIPGTGQLAKSGKYLWHVHEGKVPTPTPMEALRNLTVGPPPKEKP